MLLPPFCLAKLRWEDEWTLLLGYIYEKAPFSEVVDVRLVRKVNGLNFGKGRCLQLFIYDESSFWKFTFKGRVKLLQGLKWNIGVGDRIDFWHDNWVPFGPLCSLFIGSLPLHSINWTVKDVLNHNGDRSLDCIPFDVPVNILLPLLFTPQSTQHKDDYQSWGFDQGHCTIASATKFLSGGSHALAAFWNSIWRTMASHKIEHFLWRCCHSRIPTGSILYSPHINPLCSQCGLLGNPPPCSKGLLFC